MKPLIGHVLCPTQNIGWSKNYQSLVQLYVKAVSHDLREADLSSLRKLVGFAAQVLQFKDRTKKSNSLKEEISRDMARQLLRLNLSERRLWAELYLLEPSWLSAQVSSEMISIQTNTNISIYISIYAAHLYDSVILYAKVKIKKDKEAFIFLKLLFEVTCLQKISIKIFCLGIISGSISLTENRPIYLGCLRQN